MTWKGKYHRVALDITPVLLALLSITAGIAGVAFWKNLDSLTETVKANATSIAGMQMWRAETAANRWTSADQAAFQERMFGEMSLDRKACSEKFSELLDRLTVHMLNDHPSSGVARTLEKMENRLDRLTQDVAAIKAEVLAERKGPT